MKRGLKSIGDIMGSSGGSRLGISRTIAMANVASAWEEHMRGKFGCASSVSSINDGVLYIAVDEPVWAQQMSMLKKQILGSLAEHCDVSGVKDMRFSSFGSTEKRSGAGKPRTRAKGWPSASELRKEEAPSDGGRSDSLKEGLPEVLRRSRTMQIRTEASFTEHASGRCEVCNIQIPSGLAYCPVCALKPLPSKAAEAVRLLLESPYATDDDISEVCGLKGLDPQEAYEIVQFSRDIAGRRLTEEAIEEARSGDGGANCVNRARMLLVGSACASTGQPPDVIISRGLKSYFIPAILAAAGQTEVQSNRLDGKEKGF